MTYGALVVQLIKVSPLLVDGARADGQDYEDYAEVNKQLEKM